MPDNRTLQIHMLGEFSFTFAGDVEKLDDRSNRSRKMWTLLEYLVTHRHREISQNELIELLWPDEDTENPVNTLKTLLHRARSIVGKLGFANGKELIISRRGAYAWNNELDVWVDAEEFDALSKLVLSAPEPTDYLKQMRRALDLYKGDFLPKSSLDQWVVPLTTYYRGQYGKLAHLAVSLYKEANQPEDVIAVCEQAIVIDPYDEALHLELIRALVAIGSNQAAHRHYKYVTELFMSQFGITPSTEMTDLYREIVNTTKSIEPDLNIIRDDLRESEIAPGALFCEYTIFKDVYRLEARAAARTGQVVHIALLSITDVSGGKLPQKTCNNVMSRLLELVGRSLRRSDVYCRFSVSQYLMMLPAATYENSEMVIKRLIHNFRQENAHLSVSLSYHILPIEPLM